MFTKNHKLLSFRIYCFALILLTSFSTSVVNACSCTSKRLSVDEKISQAKEKFNQADGVYYAVITSIATVGKINKNLISGKKLDIKLTVYKTYKGKKIDTLSAIGFASLPFFDKKGEISMSSNSCEIQYFIGKEYTLITYDDEIIDLRLCSDNIFNIRYLDKAEIVNINKLTQ